jgi:hypothetical protein
VGLVSQVTATINNSLEEKFDKLNEGLIEIQHVFYILKKNWGIKSGAFKVQII